MLQQHEKYNYIPIDIEDLPSRGFCYPEGSFIKGRFLTIQDIKFLALMTDVTAERIVNEILERCFYTNISISDLALCDRTYLIFWLRANSFMKENGYRISIGKCQDCKRSFEHTIALDDIPIIQLQQAPGEVTLPRSGQVVKIKLPTVKDLKITDNDPDVQKMARMIDVDDPVGFIMKLKALDYTFLLNVIKQYDAGFDMKFEIECPHCHGTNMIECLISEQALFGQINIRDVIQLELKITKYLTYQLSDDTPWPEFEMIAELTNVMIKEENEETAKQEAAAKAKAQAAQAQAKSKSYRTH